MAAAIIIACVIIGCITIAISSTALYLASTNIGPTGPAGFAVARAFTGFDLLGLPTSSSPNVGSLAYAPGSCTTFGKIVGEITNVGIYTIVITGVPSAGYSFVNAPVILTPMSIDTASCGPYWCDTTNNTPTTFTISQNVTSVPTASGVIGLFNYFVGIRG